MRRSLLFVVLAIAFAACKQGAGGRCQVQADCDDGLVCKVATEKCTGPNTALPDAPAAPMADAATDGATDAM